MKHLFTVHSVAILLATLFSFSAFAQSDFYYTFANQPVIPITKESGKYCVEFPEGITDTTEFTGTFLFRNFFLFTDTSTLSNFASTHKVRSIYTTPDGNELYLTGELLLKFLPTATQTQKDNLVTQYDITRVTANDYYELYNSSDEVATCKSIFQSGLVEYCHPNFISKVNLHYYPTDNYFNKQFYLHNTGQLINDGKYGTPDADIDAPEAWDITKGDSNVIVAIIDQGVEKFHYDLPISKQVRLPKSNFADTNVISINDPEPYPPAGRFHGNACAGIVNAQHNNGGIAGIAPDCKIMPIRLIGQSGLIDFVSCAKSIIFADTNGAKVISNSYSVSSYQIPIITNAIQSAISNKKIVVFSTGNTAGANLGDTGVVLFPANCLLRNMITVGASNMRDSSAPYSPKSYFIDIVAPSGSGVNCLPPYTNFPDVWTCDVKYMNGLNPWPHDSLTIWFPTGPVLMYGCEHVPGGAGEALPGIPSDTFAQAFTGRFNGTSAAAPQVSGVAALMLSVNNCLTPFQLKDILLQTADKVGGYNYNWNNNRSGHSKEMGYGRLNAYKAVKAAQLTKSTSLDLFIKDDIKDVGLQPDSSTTIFCLSPDIWVRNANDSIEIHQNPEYSTQSPVYVYVRVRNKSCVDANSTSDSVILYWAKSGPYQMWPNPWTGANPSNPLMGGKIGVKPIGTIQSGEYTILKFVWNIPNPYNYPHDFTLNSANDSWHFCLLAQIKSTADANPININTQVQMYDLLKKCNNFAMKNVAVVDFSFDLSRPSSRVNGATIAVGNMWDDDRTYDIHFDATDDYPITNEAEVIVSLNTQLWNRWQNGGMQMENASIYSEENKQIIITDPHASLKNISFEADSTNRLNVQFSFITEDVTDKKVYQYLVTQHYDYGDSIVAEGGQSFFINRYDRDLFYADAGNDKIVYKDDTITLHASDIMEAATYNWYDQEDSLICTGRNLTVSPEVSSHYRLEVIADEDGFKSYDDVTVNVRQYYISSISPNPANNNFVLSYNADSASSAYIIMLHQNGYTVNSFILNTTQHSQTINVANLPTGVYNIVLVCDGNIYDAKTITVY